MQECSGMHDCSQVLAKVYLVLDGELSLDEEKALLADIDRCSHCLEHYHIEKSFKAFLVNKIERRNGSSELVSAIKQKIQSLKV